MAGKLMEEISSEFSRAEEARIQAMYAKRQGDPRYLWSNPSYLFEMQERERRVLALLDQQNFSPLGTK